MNKAKNVALIILGASAVLAYQNFGDKIKCETKNMVHNTKRKVESKLEDMKF